MPTNHDETLHERYAREHQSQLAIYARMTPEQISDMATELHNALARLAALESQQAASVGGEREAHVEFLLDEFDAGLEDLELRGRHSDLGYQKLKGLLPQFRAALTNSGAS